MGDRGLKFIYAQLGAMLGITLLLTVFNALTFSVFVITSYIALLVLVLGFNMRRSSNTLQKKIDRVLIAGGIITLIAVWFLLKPLVPTRWVPF